MSHPRLGLSEVPVQVRQTAQETEQVPRPFHASGLGHDRGEFHLCIAVTLGPGSNSTGILQTIFSRCCINNEGPLSSGNWRLPNEDLSRMGV